MGPTRLARMVDAGAFSALLRNSCAIHGASAAGRKGHARSLSSDAIAAQHASFLKEAALVAPPKHLLALFKALELKGHTLCTPDEITPDAHPFVVPLAVDASLPSGGQICLLRLPDSTHGDLMPIVRTSGLGLELVSHTLAQYLTRMAAAADWGKGGEGEEGRDAVITATNCAGTVYKPGDAKNIAGKYGFNKYVALKIGAFPDIDEGFAWGHLERGDKVSALVAAERNANKHHGWGRAYWVQSQLMSKLGREPEARDAAKTALLAPLWSLGAQFDQVAKVASGGVDVASLKEKLKVMSFGSQEVELRKGKRSREEMSLERAEQVMNCVSLGIYSWGEIREELSILYDAGGKREMATFLSKAQSRA